MTSKLSKFGSCSAVALAIATATPALAGGTLAGSTITNTATINYQVGGVAQPSINASDVFTVDRKINLTVAEVGTTTTTVVPNQAGAVTTFTLTNTSNAVLDFAVAASQLAGGTAAHGGTDNFDLTGLAVYRDTNANGTYEAGTDTVVSAYIDELAIDASVTLFVVGNVPTGRTTGDVADVRLTATVREGGGTGAQGAAITQTAGANTAAMDTVFADIAGDGDAARDGIHSDDDDYTVQTAALSLAKRSSIISDPFNGTTNPKLIPGAIVEYCIAVTNAAGGASATSVAVSDILPATITFVTGSIRLNGTTTGLTCNTDGIAGGTYASGTVSGTLATVAASDTRTLVFRATVN
ncbi:MAG: hypothetical protein ACKOUM_05400 [Sphingopyxis sp.]